MSRKALTLLTHAAAALAVKKRGGSRCERLEALAAIPGVLQVVRIEKEG